MIRLLLLLYFITMGITYCYVETDILQNPTIQTTSNTTQTTENTTKPTPNTTKITTKPEWNSMGVFKLTAYCACDKCCGRWAEERPIGKNGKQVVYTASGAVAKEGKTVAVDPTVIPFGTKLKIDGKVYVAQDSGSAIKDNRIDIYIEDHNEALEHGVKEAEVFIKR